MMIRVLYYPVKKEIMQARASFFYFIKPEKVPISDLRATYFRLPYC